MTHFWHIWYQSSASLFWNATGPQNLGMIWSYMVHWFIPHFTFYLLGVRHLKGKIGMMILWFSLTGIAWMDLFCTHMDNWTIYETRIWSSKLHPIYFLSLLYGVKLWDSHLPLSPLQSMSSGKKTYCFSVLSPVALEMLKTVNNVFSKCVWMTWVVALWLC